MKYSITVIKIKKQRKHKPVWLMGLQSNQPADTVNYNCSSKQQIEAWKSENFEFNDV